MLFPVQKSSELHTPLKNVADELERILDYIDEPYSPHDYLLQKSAIAVANDAIYVHDLRMALAIIRKTIKRE